MVRFMFVVALLLSGCNRKPAHKYEVGQCFHAEINNKDGTLGPSHDWKIVSLGGHSYFFDVVDWTPPRNRSRFPSSASFESWDATPPSVEPDCDRFETAARWEARLKQEREK